MRGRFLEEEGDEGDREDGGGENHGRGRGGVLLVDVGGLILTLDGGDVRGSGRGSLALDLIFLSHLLELDTDSVGNDFVGEGEGESEELLEVLLVLGAGSTVTNESDDHLVDVVLGLRVEGLAHEAEDDDDKLLGESLTFTGNVDSLLEDTGVGRGASDFRGGSGLLLDNSLAAGDARLVNDEVFRRAGKLDALDAAEIVISSGAAVGVGNLAGSSFEATVAHGATRLGSAFSATEVHARAGVAGIGHVSATNGPDGTTATAVVGGADSIGVGGARGHAARVHEAVVDGHFLTVADAGGVHRLGFLSDATFLGEAGLVLLSLPLAGSVGGVGTADTSSLGATIIAIFREDALDLRAFLGNNFFLRLLGLNRVDADGRQLANGEEVGVAGANVSIASTDEALELLNGLGGALLQASGNALFVQANGTAGILLGSTTLSVDVVAELLATFGGSIMAIHDARASETFTNALAVAVPANFLRRRLDLITVRLDALVVDILVLDGGTLGGGSRGARSGSVSALGMAFVSVIRAGSEDLFLGTRGRIGAENLALSVALSTVRLLLWALSSALLVVGGDASRGTGAVFNSLAGGVLVAAHFEAALAGSIRAEGQLLALLIFGQALAVAVGADRGRRRDGRLGLASGRGLDGAIFLKASGEAALEGILDVRLRDTGAIVVVLAVVVTTALGLAVVLGVGGIGAGAGRRHVGLFGGGIDTLRVGATPKDALGDTSRRLDRDLTIGIGQAGLVAGIVSFKGNGLLGAGVVGSGARKFATALVTAGALGDVFFSASEGRVSFGGVNALLG